MSQQEMHSVTNKANNHGCSAFRCSSFRTLTLCMLAHCHGLSVITCTCSITIENVWCEIKVCFCSIVIHNSYGKALGVEQSVVGCLVFAVVLLHIPID